MSIWAYGTSPHGLALPDDVLWSLTPRQHAALRQVHIDSREPEFAMFAQLRADIHNGWMPKKHGVWTAQDFGFGDPVAADDLRCKLTPEELQRKVIAMWGPDGRGHRPDKPGSAVAALKGKGQPLPKRA